ncbi:MAG: 4-hydroxybutyrate dehydrogenase [Spirochaetia bacterium]|jgi:4-hydroxybutyrate dehydrogenase|nr:4-hydroxybutyrate dehydrogenase [Spirochaetia bacterium]
MQEIIMEPSLYKFDTCREFVTAFQLGKKDLVLTNKYIFDPYFAKSGAPVHVIYQEKYGAGEPTDVMADAILADAAKVDFDRVVAIGGGTIIDLAKVLSVAGENSVDELYAQKTLSKKKELVILPTTCGTGSEVTDIAILKRTRLGVKVGLTGKAMFADYAVLVPELLESLPDYVFATSSIDALVHAVESSLSPKATAYTRLFGYKSMEMILTGYLKIIAAISKGIPAREARKPLMDDFLTASNFAGLAFGTAGCAAVHALSYPLGGTYHVAHGESNYAMFTGVLKNYMEIKSDGEIAKLNAFLAKILDCRIEVVYDQLEKLLDQLLPKKALHEYGMKREDLRTFTDDVMKTQGRLMRNSFVPLDAARVLKIYEELY